MFQFKVLVTALYILLYNVQQEESANKLSKVSLTAVAI